MKPISIVAVLFLSAPAMARAQEIAPPVVGGAAPPVAGAGFGSSGQKVISVGAASDEHLFFHKTSGAGWQAHVAPGLDFFIFSHLSIGGVLAYTHTSGAGTSTPTSNAIRFGARVGYSFDFDDRFGVWPLAGVSINWAGTDEDSTLDTFFDGLVPFLYHPAQHFFVAAGPSLRIDLSGPSPDQYGFD